MTGVQRGNKAFESRLPRNIVQSISKVRAFLLHRRVGASSRRKKRPSFPIGEEVKFIEWVTEGKSLIIVESDIDVLLSMANWIREPEMPIRGNHVMEGSVPAYPPGEILKKGGES